MITVLLVDDHEMVREGLRLSLESSPEIRIVGEASNGIEAIQQTQKQVPDVVVMDITMPQLNGIDAIPELRQLAPNVQIVILSMHSNPEYVLRALDAGALGFVLKESASREVVAAVRAVHARTRYLSPQVADALISHVVQTHPYRNPLSALSQREREVLQLIAEGRSTHEIAELIALSPKSVETYRSRIMTKLEIHDIASLVRFAIRNGLVPL
jgi:DNA-binding NarL/FixJ family response regulator